jgi:hypothetical protein
LNATPPLTKTALLAEASAVLERAGYAEVKRELGEPLERISARLYEDEYAIAALAVYETWSELRDRWEDAQGALVKLISSSLDEGEPKAWEGYLVLLTPSITPLDDGIIADDIRRNVRHVRKLVGTGTELAAIDVSAILRPLLKLEPETVLAEERQSMLALLPSRLSHYGIDEQVTKTLVDAFDHQQPLVERLHVHLNHADGS